ncbi:5'-nucleotidase C-terminal domain-containing protein [Actinotalea ferrariae]|nr:5'-nucleotidase C-terminal domain-containing protein [Actinotalea ferrariae]
MQSSRRLTRRLVPLTAAGALAGTLIAAPPAVADNHTVTIDILGINDFHGRVEANGVVAGAAVLAGAVSQFEAANPNTLFVSAGDNIGASTFTSFVAQDVPTLDVLELMDLDVSALGNHEFDQGRVDLDDRVIPYVSDTFPYLAANVYDRATGAPAFVEFHVETVDGVDVGFIGAVTEDLPALVSPAGIASLETRAIAPEVNRVAAALSDGDAANGEADVLVVLVHEGPATASEADITDTEAAFGQILRDLSAEVDAVFSGHTHRVFTYEQARDGRVARQVVQGGQYGEDLAHIELTVDRTTGDVVAAASEVLPLTVAVPAPTPRDPRAVRYDPLYPADAEVAARVAAATANAKVLGAVELGSISDDINRATQPGTDSSGNPVVAENRGGESTLGNLVADVQLWATQDLGTEIAFMNPGGLRKDLVYAPDGIVSYLEAAEVQPFANTLTVLTLTGQQIVDVLEEQWQPDGSSRPFLKLGVSGLTYTYDPTAPRGERITQVWAGDQALDLAASYRVVANSFLAAGGDNFLTFAEGTQRADSGRIDLQAFVDYMATFGSGGSAVSPDLAQRAVGVTLVDAPAQGYAAGDTVTVNLASLLFTGADGQASTVELSVGGTQVATAQLDGAAVPGTDDSGRATVSFTVPETGTPVLPGATLEVAVTVPGNGTSTSFVLPLAATTAYLEDVQAAPRTFSATVVVTNTTDAPVCGWSLVATVDQGDRILTGKQVAAVRQTGTTVTFTPKGGFGSLDAGESVRIPVQGQHDGALEALDVTSFSTTACG